MSPFLALIYTRILEEVVRNSTTPVTVTKLEAFEYVFSSDYGCFGIDVAFWNCTEQKVPADVILKHGRLDMTHDEAVEYMGLEVIRTYVVSKS